MPQARSNDIRIVYDDRGSGEPALLMLPGWCVGRGVFRDLPERCAAARRTLAMDWRGHGGSGPPEGEFGEAGLVEDALAAIAASGAQRIVPVALAHAGWVAIALRRRLGARVPGIVLVDWIVGPAPPPFLDALAGLQSPERWEATRSALLAMWLQGMAGTPLADFIPAEMGGHGFAMWARAGREIAAAYRREGSPLAALAGLAPPVPVLHLYAQPDDPGVLAAQQGFAAAHPWFRVARLAARSHFPMFEVPDRMAAEIEGFAATLPAAAGAGAP
jgi:pimeloyl-ACP methyl ester carboxylesterase